MLFWREEEKKGRSHLGAPVASGMSGSGAKLERSPLGLNNSKDAGIGQGLARAIKIKIFASTSSSGEHS